MHSVYGIQLVEQFSTCRPDSVGEAHKFVLIADMEFQIIHEFTRHIQRHFWHERASMVYHISIRI